MEIRINREDSTPFYCQLKEQIKKEINIKNLSSGTKIMPERELMSRYNLSYPTVTKALKELENEGFIKRIQGKGTFITDVTDRKKDLLTIGLVIPHLYFDERKDVKYFVKIINSMQDKAKKNRANLLFCLDNDDIEIEGENLKNLLNRKVDGIILFYIGGEKNKKILKEIQASGIPIVLIDRYVEDMDIDYVIVDNQRGAYEATKFLLDRGFNQVFHITNFENCSTNFQRIEGFKNAIAEYKIQFEDSMIKKINSTFTPEEDAYNLSKDMLEEINFPFGVFAVNFPVLVGVWKAIEEKGIKYNSLGLACFDELPINIPEEIPFVEVIQPLEEISRKSVRIIIDKLRGKKEIQQIVLEPAIQIVNESCRMTALLNGGIKCIKE